ncbi:MAG: arylamine N-acetyltransferase [Acidobacteriota bacterium]|jgi:N-hydroxyarylamine O-acetyltransferase
MASPGRSTEGKGQPEALDLAAYLRRLGLDAVPSPDLEGIETLHRAHLRSIPFEDIDVWLGHPGGLGLAELQAKMVRGGRGGYCFEQNTLFAAVLRAVGFPVRTLEARVRPPGATSPRPRTHMLLEVEVAGRAFAADVGFGGDGPLVPVPLDGPPIEGPGGCYRVERESGDLHVMRRFQADAWVDLYAFTRVPAEPVDLEVAHHYTSTHPRSPFVQTLTVQRSEPDARFILRDRSYTVRRGGRDTVRVIDDDALGPLLKGAFLLRLDACVLSAIRDRLGAP